MGGCEDQNKGGGFLDRAARVVVSITVDRLFFFEWGSEIFAKCVVLAASIFGPRHEYNKKKAGAVTC